MNIKLKNADYSQNKIGVVYDVVKLQKTDNLTAVLVIGNGFTNGQVLHYRITINDIGSATPESCSFTFGSGSADDPTNIASYIGTNIPMNIVAGNYIEGDVTVDKIEEGKPTLKLTIKNDSGTALLRTMEYTLQYYIAEN